jgi:hypothetical protein
MRPERLYRGDEVGELKRDLIVDVEGVHVPVSIDVGQTTVRQDILRRMPSAMGYCSTSAIAADASSKACQLTHTSDTPTRIFVVPAAGGSHILMS